MLLLVVYGGLMWWLLGAPEARPRVPMDARLNELVEALRD